ncbi:MAG: ARPP-1 family domain-containing protein [Promethearchaeota archaeon]
MHKVLKSNWNKLLEGYALDAFEEIAKESAKICIAEEAIKKVQEFVDQLNNAKIEIIKNPRKSAGDDHRIDSEEVTGQALVTEDKVLHMAVFSRSTWKKDELNPLK